VVSIGIQFGDREWPWTAYWMATAWVWDTGRLWSSANEECSARGRNGIHRLELCYRFSRLKMRKCENAKKTTTTLT